MTERRVNIVRRISFSSCSIFHNMKNCKGYTLAELLVSIAIITVIAGTTLVYFRQGNKTWALTRSAQKLSQDVRRASNMALSSPQYTCPASESIDGYGVYFSASDNTSYILFADCDADNSYDGEATDVKIETISLESGVKIKGVNPDLAGSFSVVFVPPDPTTNFSSGTSGTVTLSFISDENQTKQVAINNKGNINIQ